MTVVERVRASGIERIGDMVSGFRYRLASGGKPTASDLRRIEVLKVPPAWRDVAIARSAHAAVQAVGRDAAGRWQYLYHERAVARRERRKYERLVAFTRSLPSLRKKVARDLARTGIGRERVLACVVRILAACFVRPGSDEYVEANGSYGVATLRRKHVELQGARLKLSFDGKSGVRQEHAMEDRRAALCLRALLREPGSRVFRFRDETGVLRPVRRHHINAYIKEAMGDAFSAKDFRTWAGTLACACALARTGLAEEVSATAVRKRIAAAVKETATVLGNTPAVCRSSYISPAILSAYEEGRTLSHPRLQIAAIATSPSGRLSACERELLRLLAGNGKKTTRLAA